MTEITWQEFDRHDRIVTKRKEFKNAPAAERFIDKITEKDNFYRITATRQDEEYSEWEKKRQAELEEMADWDLEFERMFPDHYTPDDPEYSPSSPWNAPGMKPSDFI